MTDQPPPEAMSLQPITADNWRLVVRLSLKPGQEHFVAPNWYSILQAHFEGGSAKAIYTAETLIGFVWYTFDAQTNQWWIVRFMISAEHQGKHYGRAALHTIIREIRDQHHPAEIYISFEPENEPARKLYESIGFADTGRIEDGELVFCLDLSQYQG
ncbi:MAG: GNAT family N-acetyltransferase [Anaerolinea sp.]|nr:GNAT family N-acetyltransferase [Anaerolinea sp.]MCC6972396.1 GNAT family N-acetyltransferase [Anaerolineae bacterium]